MSEQTLRRPWELLILGAIAAVFTLVVIQYSFAQGRLSLSITYDDVTYFLDGARRLDAFTTEGFPGLARQYLDSPPHSPLSSGMAFLAFLCFGLRDWAPYALNGILLLGMLLFFHRCLTPFATWIRMACLGFLLTVPLSAMMVHEFRPDLGAALLTAMGAVRIIMPRERDAERRNLLVAGIWFGLAAVAKPSVFPHTLGVLGATMIVDALHRRFASPGDTSWASLARRCLVLGTVALAVALPHFAADWEHIAEYIGRNVFGEHAGLWRPARGAGQQSLYFLTGDGGDMMLGGHLFLLGAIIVIGAAALGRSPPGGERRGGLCRLALVALCSYLFVSANPTKNPFFGATFQILGTLVAVMMLAGLLEAPPGRPCGAAQRWCGGAFLVGAGALWFPLYPSASAALPPPAERKALDQVCREIVFAIEQERGEGPATVFVVTTGLVSAPTLQWIAARRNLPLACADLHRSPQFDAYRKRMENSRFTVAPDANAPGIAGALPSAQVAPQALAYLRNHPRHVPLRRIRCPGAGAYYLFRKDPFGGYTSAAGLGPREAPSRQGEAQPVRRGYFPRTRLVLHRARPGSYRLLMEALPQTAGQRLRIALDDAETVRVDSAAPGAPLQAAIPFRAGPGWHSLTLAYEEDPGAGSAVIYRRLEIVPEDAVPE